MPQTILQSQFNLSGQSQDQRLPLELQAEFVVPDERDLPTLLNEARKLAKHLRLYQWSATSSSGDWSSFFPEGNLADLLNQLDGKTPPHQGLLLAFLRLYRYPQQQLNQLTQRHLLCQFREVLRFEPKAAHPDHAHLILQLKKNAAPIAVGPQHRFSAGKDATGVELLYQPLRETVINSHQVEKLHSILVDTQKVRFAAIANSADGLGAEFDSARVDWSAFGETNHPIASIGIALASSTLRLAGGQRKVILKISLDGLHDELTASQFSNSFAAYFSGPAGWTGPFDSQHTSLSKAQLQFEFNLSEAEAAIVDYQPALHGHAFRCATPVLQLLLKTDASLPYAQLQSLIIARAQITVEVSELAPLALENDDGKLNPKKAFLPFGSQPTKGMRFKIDCPEALSKKLHQLSVKLDWAAPPTSLSSWYSGYQNANRISNGISAWISYTDAGQQNSSHQITLLSNTGTTSSTLSSGTPPLKLALNATEQTLNALLRAGSIQLHKIGQRLSRTHLQNYRPRIRIVAPPHTVPDRIAIELIEDFLHADYRRETLANALAQNKKVLNEPYTPKVQQISLSYRASSTQINFEANHRDSFANDDLMLFHVGCFGQRREHSYVRQQYRQLSQKQVPLLPEYPFAGELLIGIRGAKASDSLSLLLQTAAGTADPELTPSPLSWSVLCDNYWQTLTPQQLIQDSSQGLRDSGILICTLPRETSVEHSWMPSGLVWLRATVTQHSRACNRLLQIASNALEVVLLNQSQHAQHLLTALPAQTISKLKTALPSIKTISQPFASFGGYPQESDAMLVRRASEQLRHRNRCISAWDYERLVLEHFPQLYKVKCINHAKLGSWQAPGHVRLIVVPKILESQAGHLQAKVDVATIDQVQQLAQQHASQRIQIHVSNPLYQAIQLKFKVRFYPGYDFHYYRNQLEQALIRQLSPWLDGNPSQIEFGGRIYRSVLLNFVEQQDYVDFVTDFSLAKHDPASISASTPDAILVSANTHEIEEYVA